VKNCCKLLLAVLFAMLVKPEPGLGQQATGARFDSLVAAAQQAQAARDYTAAVDAYKQAVKIEPAMPELWANLGLMQQEAGDIPSAILSYQQANHLNPSLYVPNLFLGIDSLRTGRAPEAIPFLIKAEKLNKTDPQAPLTLGRAYFATGKFSFAAQKFTRTTTLDPKLGAAWFALGLARLNQVEADARKMSTDSKDSPFARALYAESLEKQARFSEAASLYRGLLVVQPQPPCLHSELGLALLKHRDLVGAATEFAADRTANPECGMAVLGLARMALESGEKERAVKLLDELWARDHGFVSTNSAILLDGLSSDASASVAEYFAQPGTAISADLRDALLAAFNGSGQAVDVGGETMSGREGSLAPSPETGVVNHKTAEQYYAAGEFTLCAQRLDPAVVTGRADKLKLLAACSYFAGDDVRASNAAAALETLQPHSAEALYWSIQANERLALQSLTRFQRLESDSARSHVLLGDIFEQLQRFDDAQAEYSKALVKAPGDPAAMLGLASAYLSNNNIEKAIETASVALKHSPDDPEVNLVMAEAMVDKDRFAEAEPFLMKCLNVKPQTLVHVHALIGKVYAETGRTKDAIDQLKMGESSDENGSIHYLLARLYRQLGDVKDASAAIDQVKAIKEQRRDRGVKLVEDPELSSLESPPGQAPAP
jgi:tetratricopeptide (TPR) repeat protein